MKISFDFDGTLEDKKVQDFAKTLIDQGHQVCILTTRYSDPNRYEGAKLNPELFKTMHDRLFTVAKNLGITEIHFTEFEWKTNIIDKLNINIHIDDNFKDEVSVINSNNKAKAVLYDSFMFDKTKEQVIKLIHNL